MLYRCSVHIHWSFIFYTKLHLKTISCHANIHKERERENRERDFNPSLEKNANQIWFADANYKSMLIHTNY